MKSHPLSLNLIKFVILIFSPFLSPTGGAVGADSRQRRRPARSRRRSVAGTRRRRHPACFGRSRIRRRIADAFGVDVVDGRLDAGQSVAGHEFRRHFVEIRLLTHQSVENLLAHEAVFLIAIDDQLGGRIEDAVRHIFSAFEGFYGPESLDNVEDAIARRFSDGDVFVI